MTSFELLLKWYQSNGRKLPWRSKAADPYHVMLSEFMLQQTTVVSVKPYFERFITLWPRVENMANADPQDVMSEWAGLGYYARARNLLKAARAISELGDFPTTPEGLQKLPGVGPYTAAAIAAIAFDDPILPLDGNIKRILSRLYAIEAPIDRPNPELKNAQQQWAHPTQSGDIAQAMMDLGALVCRPKNPKCDQCPLRASCRVKGRDDISEFPRKTPKRAKKHLFAHVYRLNTPLGIGFEMRPENGLLGGMWALPTSDWKTEIPDFDPPISGEWVELGTVRHVFTHIDLELTVWGLDVKAIPKTNQLSFIKPQSDQFSEFATLWRKVLALQGHHEIIETYE